MYKLISESDIHIFKESDYYVAISMLHTSLLVLGTVVSSISKKIHKTRHHFQDYILCVKFAAQSNEMK